MKRWPAGRRLAAAVCATLLWACPAAGDAEQGALVQLFDQRYFSRELPAGPGSRYAGYERAMRDDAFVSWGYGEWLNTLATMYQATGDERYGAAALALVKLAFANRDDQLGRTSPQADRPLPGWGEPHYLPVRADTVTNTGMVIWPAMRFANIARARNGQVWQENQAFIAAIAERTRQGFGMFAGDLVRQRRNGLELAWFTEARGLAPVLEAQDCGARPGANAVEIAARRYCRFTRDNAGRPLPFNMSLIMGAYAIELLKWQGNRADPRLAETVLGLFNHFVVDGRLRPNPADPGAWQWQYMADGYSQEGKANRPGRIEDIAHGAVDIAFLTALHEAFPLLRRQTGLPLAMPVDDRLMQGFARAFAGPMTGQGPNGPVLAQHVDGRYPGGGNANSRCSAWIRLARWEPAVARTCMSLIVRPGNPPTLDPANAEAGGLAELIAAQGIQREK